LRPLAGATEVRERAFARRERGAGSSARSTRVIAAGAASRDRVDAVGGREATRCDA